ncbi:MAG TPA: hypothetical protein DDW65_21725 [Firmicutes bacterium]|jgi:putative transposase|nr:hypothetical protein [Bacillota bacterium]
MPLHRNSQKRLYVPDGIYFITTNTYDRLPYFENEILCELFLETLDFTSLIKEFNIHGWAINLEHLHLLIQPTGKYNYSEIMGTLKRNFSRDCNDPYFKAHVDKLFELQSRFLMDCNRNSLLPFKWQSSFHDHLIRDEKDYQNHLEYIQNQPLKHQLADRKWYWIVGAS